MSDQIMVSVCMITYNHEKFIGQAIESVMNQETNFPFELIIGNDRSTDKTDEVIRSLIAQNKNSNCQIVYLYREKNIGMMKNADSTFSHARGKYIAQCEGDDFWQDRRKLQKQFDAMEADPTSTICFHAINIVDKDGKLIEEQRLRPDIEPSFKSLMKNNFIHTPTVMYRNIFKPLILDWMMEFGVGDWILHLRHAEVGKIIYLDEVLASYRVHTGGVWSMADVNLKQMRWITVVDAVIKNMYPQYELGLNFTKRNCLLTLASNHFFSAKFSLAFKYFFQALKLKTDPPMTLRMLASIAARKVYNKFLRMAKKAHA